MSGADAGNDLPDPHAHGLVVLVVEEKVSLQNTRTSHYQISTLHHDRAS